MKKILKFSVLAISISLIRHTGFAIDLSGTYDCIIYENDHSVHHAMIKYLLDPKSSDIDHGIGAYHFEGGFQKDGSYIYSGEAISHGDTMAEYFQSKKDKNDSGIEVISIKQEFYRNGREEIDLQKLTYESPYLNGSTIEINCSRRGVMIVAGQAS